MKAMKTALALLIFLGIGAFVIYYYSYIFAKSVTGKIERVERVDINVALMQTSGAPNEVNPQLFSFAVGVKDDTGVIYTASAEDRQWAVASPGQCVEAKFYPYPPWNLEKSGTFFNARLIKLWDCK